MSDDEEAVVVAVAAATSWKRATRLVAVACDACLAFGMEAAALAPAVRERLDLGRERYGPLDLATDQRDFTAEMREELIDALAYAAMESVRQRR